MWDPNNVKGEEAQSIELCLEMLQQPYVDLMLIHNPCAQRAEYNAAGLPHFFELFTAYENENAAKPVALPDGYVVCLSPSPSPSPSPSVCECLSLCLSVSSRLRSPPRLPPTQPFP
jgi:hypothetical protein